MLQAASLRRWAATPLRGVREAVRVRLPLLLRPLFVVGLAVGYVVGARAGRDRYEALVRTARSFAERPVVQGVAGLVTAKAGSLLRPSARG